MWVKGVGTAAFVLLGLFASVNVKAQTSTTPYAVNGLQLGAQLAPNSGAYREYHCSPSGQFSGLTWCSRSAAEKGSYGQKSASYSLLHTADGTIVYANRATDLSSFKQDAAKKELQRLVQRYGTPRIIDMPSKPKAHQGMIASWGDVVLEPLDAASISQLALGKSPNKGLIIDFLGNFRRSAQLGLPVYRMTGGAGFVWAASFNKKGAGTLRFAAVNPSALSAPGSASPPVAAEPAAQPTENEAQAQPQAPAKAQPQVQPPVQAQAQPAIQRETPAQPQPSAQSQAPAQPQQIQPQAAASEPTPAAPVAAEAAPDAKLAELNQTIDQLKWQLASYAKDVIQLEKEKGEAQQALPQLHQALNDADTARQQAQASALVLKGQLDAAIRRSNNLAYAMLAGTRRRPAQLWRGFRWQVETSVVGAPGAKSQTAAARATDRSGQGQCGRPALRIGAARRQHQCRPRGGARRGARSGACNRAWRKARCRARRDARRLLMALPTRTALA